MSVDGKGLLVIISAPSGAGKDASIERLVKKVPDAVVYVTATSRKPRPGEVDGVRYYFYTPEKFRQEIEAGNFFEWSIVHGEFKGVRRDILGDTLRDHKIVIVKPDPQGMRKIKSQLPEALTIFIMPPSIEALQRRLEHRGTETPEQRAVRLRNAEIEMAAAPEYDYVVVNEDGKLDETVDKIAEIIKKEAKRPRHYELRRRVPLRSRSSPAFGAQRARSPIRCPKLSCSSLGSSFVSGSARVPSQASSYGSMRRTRERSARSTRSCTRSRCSDRTSSLSRRGSRPSTAPASPTRYARCCRPLSRAARASVCPPRVVTGVKPSSH